MNGWKCDMMLAHVHTHTPWNTTQSLKKLNSAIYNNMVGPRGQYA